MRSRSGRLSPLRRRRSGFLAIALLLLLCYSGNDRPDSLQKVYERGKLIMLTRNGASTYYLGAQGPTGPEYELVSEFARTLDVALEVVTAPSFGALESLLKNGQGDLVAANLTRTPQREFQFNFGPDYMETETLVVYRRGQPRPADFNDLAARKIMIIQGSSYEEALEEAATSIPGLQWESRSDVAMEDLMQALSDGAIDITLVDSTIFALNSPFYPSVAAAFALPGSMPHAWAFPPGNDDQLAQKARVFMRQARQDGRLDAITKAFYSPKNRLDRVGMFQFLQQVRERLPPLLPMFQAVAEAHELDWRLLAAMGYQESHWDPLASSYTGVRGIMMLTQPTATQLGVDDRLDPQQSIEGGARYFLEMRGRIPDRIPEPDRSWMALAAYNMGMGHLEDVRVLTQNQGGNADSWDDVRQRLVLLSQEKWHSQTRYGYARGFETEQYVRNVRRYYEILQWMETRDHPLLAALSSSQTQ